MMSLASGNSSASSRTRASRRPWTTSAMSSHRKSTPRPSSTSRAYSIFGSRFLLEIGSAEGSGRQRGLYVSLLKGACQVLGVRRGARASLAELHALSLADRSEEAHDLLDEAHAAFPVRAETALRTPLRASTTLS